MNPANYKTIATSYHALANEYKGAKGNILLVDFIARRDALFARYGTTYDTFFAELKKLVPVAK
jgi:hypothetical protein